MSNKVKGDLMTGKTLIRCRGLGIRHSNIYAVTQENYESYLKLSKENKIWGGHIDCEDYVYEYEQIPHLTKDDPRIRIYLRQVESLSLDKKSPDTLVVKFKDSYKELDLLKALKRQSDIPLKDCLEFLPKTYETSRSVYCKALRIKIEAGYWLSGHERVYISARSIYAAYRAWLDVAQVYSDADYIAKRLQGKTQYLTPYYKSCLKNLKKYNKKLNLSQSALLVNMWCHAIMNEAGQHELLELRDKQAILTTSYVYNPVQPVPRHQNQTKKSKLRQVS